MDILGYDVNGRPLRAGDRVKVVAPVKYPHLKGANMIVTGPSQWSDCVVTDHPHPDPTFDFCNPECGQIRRLDDRTDHQPSEYTYDELLDSLKAGAPNHAKA